MGTAEPGLGLCAAGVQEAWLHTTQVPALVVQRWQVDKFCGSLLKLSDTHRGEMGG